MNLLNIALQKPNILNSTPVQAQVQQDWKPIATVSLIKPDRPNRSYIVNDPFYMAPVNFVTDIKENLVNIKNGIMGKSNDHDLGRINDFSMKAGALGLAGYLFTRGKTPMTKAMEFVGFGTFFASMALWPKLFIQSPIKAMYGLDIHQRYVDNEGRKKMFFQDPQYIPWDLYTDEDLAKLGDKLGVPRDIHNRNEVIKKKAHKIALQGNTLWMLTAGFATPLMSALMCNAIEKIATPRSEKSSFPSNVSGAIGASIEKGRLEAAENNLKNAASIVADKLAKYDPKNLNALLQLNAGQEVSSEVISDLTNFLAHDKEVLHKRYLRHQIEDITSVEVKKVSAEYVEKFREYLQTLGGDSGKKVNLSVITDNDLAKLADMNLSIPAFNKRVVRIAAARVQSGDDSTSKVIKDACLDFAKENSKKFVLTPEVIQQIRSLDKNLYEYSIRRGLIENCYNVYFNNAAETVAANRWNNFADSFLKSLGMSSKEIERVKMGESSATRILRKKLEEVALDDKKYESAVRRVYNAILDYDKTVLPDAASSSQGVKKMLQERYTDFYNTTAEKFRELGFNKISDRLVGDSVSSQGSLLENSLDKLNRRPSELRNGMYKVLHTLDFFRRTSDIESGVDGSQFVRDYMRFSNSHGGVDLRPTQETLKKDVSLYKDLLLNGTIADHTTKLGYQNPQMGLYDRLMKLIFNADLSDKTRAILGETVDGVDKSARLGETTFLESFTSNIKNVLANLGNSQNPHATDVTTKGIFGGGGDILVKDSFAGPRLDRLVRETASQAFNSSKWFKMFGGMTAALIGITLLSETFFGKLSKEDIYGRKDKH